jgi:hypothetical protein
MTHLTNDIPRDTSKSDYQFVESNASKQININSIKYPNKEFEEFDIGVQKIINYYKDEKDSGVKIPKNDVILKKIQNISKLSQISEEMLQKSSENSTKTQKNANFQPSKNEQFNIQENNVHQNCNLQRKSGQSPFRRISLNSKQLRKIKQNNSYELNKEIYKGQLDILLKPRILRLCDSRALNVLDLSKLKFSGSNNLITKTLKENTQKINLKPETSLKAYNLSPKIIQKRLSNTNVIMSTNQNKRTSSVPRHSVTYVKKRSFENQQTQNVQAHKQSSEIKTPIKPPKQSIIIQNNLKENIRTSRTSTNVRYSSVNRQSSYKKSVFHKPLAPIEKRNSIILQPHRRSICQTKPTIKVESNTSTPAKRQIRYSLASGSSIIKSSQNLPKHYSNIKTSKH